MHLGWFGDNEPLFGERTEAKLIVSMSFGSQALFKWKGKFVHTMVPTRGGLTKVTFLSWMFNVRTSFFTGRIPVRNRNGLTLRSVGFDNMLHPVLS